MTEVGPNDVQRGMQSGIDQKGKLVAPIQSPQRGMEEEICKIHVQKNTDETDMTVLASQWS